MLPRFGDGQQVQIKIVLLGLQQLKPFGVGLHQTVFHAVVNHLGEMTGAGRAHSTVPAVGSRRQCLEDGLQPAEDRLIPAHHQGISFGQSPDATAGSRIEQVNATLRQHLPPAQCFPIIRVAAVDDCIPVRQQFGQVVHT